MRFPVLLLMASMACRGSGPSAGTDRARVQQFTATPRTPNVGPQASGSNATSAPVDVEALEDMTLELLDHTAGWVNAKSYGPPTSASIQAAIDALPPTGGVVLVPGGTWEATAPIVVSKLGVHIVGEGYHTVINVNHPGDAFQISSSMARFEKLEIQIGTAADRAGAAVFDVLPGGYGGRIHDIRVTGHPGSMNNGMMFREDTAAAGFWVLDTIQISGGHHWTSIVRLSADSAQGTCASHYIHMVGGTRVYVTAAFFDLEGALDTVEIEGSGGDTIGGPVLWTHTPRASEQRYFPRWVMCTGCSGEAWDSADAIYTAGAAHAVVQLDSGRDLRWINGYVGSAGTGLAIGANTQGVDVSHTEFVNIGRSAVTLAAGAIGTTLAYNTYEDIGLLLDDSFDTIAVAPGAGSFRILYSDFHNSLPSPRQANPRYHVAIGANAGAFTIRGNDFRVPGASGNIYNPAPAGNFWIRENTAGVDGAETDITHSTAPTLHNGADVVFNPRVVVRQNGIASESGSLVLNSSSGDVQINGHKMTWSASVPTGTYSRGDVAWNAAAAGGAPMGWMCAADPCGGGNGWKAMAALAP